MKVLIAAGGTGGHIYPGIAVANEILRRDENSEVRFAGTEKGLETKIVPDNGFELSLINSVGLKNVGLAGKIRGLFILPKSFLESRKLLKEFKPDAVVGAGGYVTGAVLLMASFMKIPTLVMESNALPGFTNRQLARFVNKAALTFEEAVPYFGDKGIVTGNPVRKEFFEIKPKERSENLNVLLFGGSQGARAINLAMIDALEFLKDEKNNLSIFHQTGKYDFETVKQGYDKNSWDSADIREYISDMVSAFEKTDLIISRAGATTCAEVAAAGKVAIMIPLPTAADDHQRKNAEALENNKAATMILQDDLTGETLANEIKQFMAAPEKINEMGLNAKNMAKADAAEITANLIEELVNV